MSDIVDQLDHKLSVGLNKPKNTSLTLALIRFYINNNSLLAFSTYLQAIGAKDTQFTNEIYDIINDNIGRLETLLKEGDRKSSAKGVELPKTKTKPSEKKKVILFNFEDEDELEDITLPLNKPDNTASTPSDFKREKPKFKKIKKEKAMMIREEARTSQTENGAESTTPSRPQAIDEENSSKSVPMSLSELAEQERKDSSISSSISTPVSTFDDVFSSTDPNDIELDREWYTAEEYGQVAQDHDDYYEYEEDSKNNNSRTIIQQKRHNKSSATGGSFDRITGEYIDHDHDENLNNATDITRIPITSHYLVPPFLKKFQEYLSVVEFGSLSKSIGPMIDPIKEPLSELAVAARHGSSVVRERKSNREKAKQARERAGIEGTRMGNVLQVDNARVENEEPNSEVEDEENAEEVGVQKSMKLQRTFLPVFSVRSKLLRTIAENQVIIVVGETGSGKTTQLTQYLHEEGYTHEKKVIGCTQPRRVAAMSVAKRVSEEMDCKLGSEVGYSIRFEDVTTSKTVIKYLTEGILLREVLADPSLENYLCIIMDEAHERSLNTDVLLGLFKTTVLPRRRDLKLIITSATMNADRFSNFFGDAPQFTIPGRTYPVDVLYSRLGSSDYVDTAAKQVLSIHLLKWLEFKGVNDGDILVFMTGQDDIEATVDCIKEKLELLDNPPPIDIYPIYSSMPADLQQKIFRKLNKNRRKCVVATNIAETSLTVDGIKYVVDSGLSKVKVYNAKLGMDTLQVVPVSLANAQQRSGRAGRTGPGTAFRLYTERATSREQMYVQPIPEIQRTNLSNISLMLKSMKIRQISDFPFLDPPPQDLLSCSLYELWSMGALNNFGELTALGENMNLFPMEPSLAKLIWLLVDPKFHCLEEIIIIVSMLSVPSCYYRPKERAQEADMIRDKFTVLESDHLTYLNIFRQWEAVPPKKRETWCTKNFFHARSLNKAKDIRQQLLAIMQKLRLPTMRAKDDIDIRKCLCASFFQQLAKLVKSNVRTGGAEYVNLRHNYMKMYLHPTSSLNSEMSPPLYVIYQELILTTKEYMSCVTAVDPLWLLEYGSIFYGVLKNVHEKIKDELTYTSKNELESRLNKDEMEYLDREQKAKFKKKRPLVEGSKFRKFNRGF